MLTGVSAVGIIQLIYLKILCSQRTKINMPNGEAECFHFQWSGAAHGKIDLTAVNSGVLGYLFQTEREQPFIFEIEFLEDVYRTSVVRKESIIGAILLGNRIADYIEFPVICCLQVRASGKKNEGKNN